MPVSDEEFLQKALPALDLVYNLARRLVPRREDAEDLVQETYLAAYKAWQEHRRPRKLEPWIATICLNLARSGYRHRARRPQEVPWEELAPMDTTADPEAQAIAGLDQRALHVALWALRDEERQAIALVDLDGFSVRETASIMGTPIGTVLSRLHRGRKSLAGLLATEVGESERVVRREEPE